MMKRTDVSIPQAKAVNYVWNHDIIPGKVFNMPIIVEGKYPELADQWFDSIQGGYQVTFKDDSGEEYSLVAEEGVRCMGCEGVIAFDSEGKGVNYL